MPTNESRSKIASSFTEKGNIDYKILVEVKGSYLIENNIVQEWADQRSIDPLTITPEWSDYVTLNQALHLGMLDFVFKHA